MRWREFFAVAGGTITTFTLPVKAEPPQVPVVGFLGSGTSDALPPITAALRDGLRQQGLEEGRNVVFEFAMAEGDYDRIPDLAREFVRKNVRAIVTQAPPATLAARRTTSTIPIVFAMGADPVRFGLVESLNRPGGNVTGVMIS